MITSCWWLLEIIMQNLCYTKRIPFLLPSPSSLYRHLLIGFSIVEDFYEIEEFYFPYSPCITRHYLHYPNACFFLFRRWNNCFLLLFSFHDIGMNKHRTWYSSFFMMFSFLYDFWQSSHVRRTQKCILWCLVCPFTTIFMSNILPHRTLII